MAKYYCYDCGKSFDFDDDGYQEHECPNGCGELVVQDTYDEDASIASDPYGDLGGKNGYAQDEEGNWYAR